MKYVLVGAGNIGQEIIKDILTTDREARLLAIDFNPQALERAQALSPEGRVQTRLSGAESAEALAPLLEGAAVVINCTYGERIVDILKACILARVCYVDINGTMLLEERLALNDAARDAGITALICMGVSPGLTNMLAAYGARQFDGDVAIDCEYATHRPLNITEGLLETALRQFRNGVKTTVVEERKVKTFEPFHGRKRVAFPHLEQGVDVIYTPHTEPLTVSRFVENAASVTVRGTYEHRIMQLLESLSRFGLLDPALTVEIDGKPVSFQPVLRQALMGDGRPRPGDITGLYVMRVRVAQQDRSMEITVGHPPGWEAIPQGRMTALPTSFSAQLVARRELAQPGVCVPENFTDAMVEDCLRYLEARGMEVGRRLPEP